MVERLDIDALLIGALYSELTPAEEARLTAHLESHPGDRVALDDLKSARLAVRESRILEAQLEPPQAISAMLLQEAARRAPRQARRSDEAQESWFQRFIHSFMRHPAMAAAAMLVVVVGVAGTMYMKNGDQFAEKSAPMGGAAPAATPTAEDREHAENAPENTVVEQQRAGRLDEGTAAAHAKGGDGIAAGSAARYEVDLAGKNEYKPTTPSTDKLEANRGQKAKPVAPPRATAMTKSAKKPPYIQVQTNDPSPKDMVAQETTKPAAIAQPKPEPKLDRSRGNDSDDSSTSSGATNGATVTVQGPTSGKGGYGYATAPQKNVPAKQPARSAPVTTSVPGGVAPAPPPPAAAPRDQQIAADRAPAKKTADDARKVDKPVEKSPDDTLLAWAKGEHSRAISVANNGNCSDAARIVVGIQNRAPEYYAQNMATDRALKRCQQYINDARDKDAEQNAKARASKRVNAESPSSVK